MLSSPGDLAILGGVTITINSNGTNTQLTLICITTGGPVTTVTWTRDNVTVTEGAMTVLDDRVTAQYTHTLTMNETNIFNGIYSCESLNDKPSLVTIKTTITYTGYGNLCVLFTCVYMQLCPIVAHNNTIAHYFCDDLIIAML